MLQHYYRRPLHVHAGAAGGRVFILHNKSHHYNSFRRIFTVRPQSTHLRSRLMKPTTASSSSSSSPPPPSRKHHQRMGGMATTYFAGYHKNSSGSSSRNNFFPSCIHRLSFGTTTSHSNDSNDSNNNDDDDRNDSHMSTEWIPPPGKFSKTKHQHQQQEKLESKVLQTEKEDNHQHDDNLDGIPLELLKYLNKQSRGDEEETVEYIDLSRLNKHTKKKNEEEEGQGEDEVYHQKQEEQSRKNYFSIEEDDISSLEELWKEVGMDGQDDDNDDDDDDDEYEDMDDEEIQRMWEEEERELRAMGAIELGEASLSSDDAILETTTTTTTTGRRSKQQNEQDEESDEIKLGEQPVSTSIGRRRGLDSKKPDWLRTRRARLGEQVDDDGDDTKSSSRQPIGMMKPEDARVARTLDSEIPIIKRKLLTSSEIVTCLSSLGGQDIQLIAPTSDVMATRMGVPGGLIIVTGVTFSHIRTMAEAIVRNLRRRDLQSMGVVGAQFGPEGGVDGMTPASRSRSGLGGGSGRADDGWMVVDCGNYVVHVQDEMTRRHINLEGLWSTEVGSEGHKLRSVDWNDENAVDEYVANNPIPDEYARKMLLEVGSLPDIDLMRLSGFDKKGSGRRWTPQVTKQHKKKKSRSRRKR